MCNECNGTGVIYEYYLNANLKQVSSDWIYCETCYPESIGTFQSPWNTDYKIISNEEFYKYVDRGYQEVFNR